MINLHHLVFSSKKKITYTVPVKGNVIFQFSTRGYDLMLKSSIEERIITLKNVDFTQYDFNSPIPGQINMISNSTDEVKIIAENKDDIYSIGLIGYNSSFKNIIINDFGSFIKQFENLYSFCLSIHWDGNTSLNFSIKGDLSQIPNSLQKLKASNLSFQLNPNDLYLNVSNFSPSSQLRFLLLDYFALGQVNTYGNLAKLPSQLYYFKLDRNTGTFIYSGTKVWASSFDTLDLGNATLSATETDNLFNDMANSITTAIGSKIIRLANCYRTSASNAAVAYLQSLGFTITVVGIGAKILDLPLQNNFTDTTGINTMIAGGTSNLPTFTLDGGEYAATFNGSQSLKTNANFNVGTDKVSISLWLKTSQTTLGNILELSNDFNYNNAFSSFINDSIANKITIYDHNTAGDNYGTSAININDNTWRHIVLMIDRSKAGSQQNSIYINGVLSYVQNTTKQTNYNGNWSLYPLFIGQRAGNSLGLNGQIKFLKIFNYPLSQSEITKLFNKTM